MSYQIVLLLIFISICGTFIECRWIAFVKERARVKAEKEMLEKYQVHLPSGCKLRCERCDKLCSDCWAYYHFQDRARERGNEIEGKRDGRH